MTQFNLAETTWAWSIRGRGQAQKNPNSAKAPTVEVECEENPAQWKRRETQRAGNHPVEVTRNSACWKPEQQKLI